MKKRKIPLDVQFNDTVPDSAVTHMKQWRQALQDQQDFQTPMFLRRDMPPCQGAVGEFVDVPVILTGIDYGFSEIEVTAVDVHTPVGIWEDKP